MTARAVLRYPHPALKQVARPLGADELDRVRQVVHDMIDTMRSHQRCVGLAAPQLGELVRVVVVDVREHPRGQPNNGLLELINPRVLRESGSEVAREGCLSIPELTANVRRATEIAVEAMTPSGECRTVTCAAFEARCVLHEIDHLDGILFLDRVDSLSADVFPRKARSS